MLREHKRTLAADLHVDRVVDATTLERGEGNERKADEMSDIPTGKCKKCGKPVALGKDGACVFCDAEICWECWIAANHVCPVCEEQRKDGKG
jgi:hypothetical protein